MPKLAPTANHAVSVIALSDPAIDLESAGDEIAAIAEKYRDTLDESLLPLRSGMTPVRWLCRPLKPVEHSDAAAQMQAEHEESPMAWVPFVRAGFVGAENIPEEFGMPVFTERLGVRRCALDWLLGLPPEIITDLGMAIVQLSTADESTKKKLSAWRGRQSSETPKE